MSDTLFRHVQFGVRAHVSGFHMFSHERERDTVVQTLRLDAGGRRPHVTQWEVQSYLVPHKNILNSLPFTFLLLSSGKELGWIERGSEQNQNLTNRDNDVRYVAYRTYGKRFSFKKICDIQCVSRPIPRFFSLRDIKDDPSLGIRNFWHTSVNLESNMNQILKQNMQITVIWLCLYSTVCH